MYCIPFSCEKMGRVLSFDEVRIELRRTDKEYRQLEKKHVELDTKISCLSDKTDLTETEELALKQMKKKKIRLKDQMTEIISNKRSHEE